MKTGVTFLALVAMLMIFTGASLAALKIDLKFDQLNRLLDQTVQNVIINPSDKGLMEAFPAEVRQVAPSQFQSLPGPRFEPSRNVLRVEFLNPASRLIALMLGE